MDNHTIDLDRLHLVALVCLLVAGNKTFLVFLGVSLLYKYFLIDLYFNFQQNMRSVMLESPKLMI